MPKADQTPAYADANLEPTSDPTELRRWWKRRVGHGYYPYIVKVLRREQKDKLDFLTFELAGDASRLDPRGPFTVELNNQADWVWSELPSTAQHATEAKPYGFLMLTMEWARSNNVDAKIHSEGGGKWPASTGDAFSVLTQRVMSDEVVRGKVIDVFDTLVDSIRQDRSSDV